MLVFDQIIRHGSDATIGYLMLIAVLGAIALYMFWRARGTMVDGVIQPLVLSLLVFAVARIPIWEIRLSSVEANLSRLFVFSSLSFVGFWFAATVILRFTRPAERSSAGSSNAGSSSLQSTTDRILYREMFYLGALGAALFLFRPFVESITAFVLGLANFVVVGASIRLIAFGVGEISKSPSIYKRGFLLCTAVFTSSWLLYETTPLVAEEISQVTVYLARLIDVLSLTVIVGLLFSGYVRWGAYCDALARENRREREIANTELAKLNKIAKDIYEDSNDLMIKQKEQALASLKKVERLEKILEMGTAIQQRKKLEDLLQMIVELVRDNLGFKTVVLRLLNIKAQSFETKAHVGLGDDVRDEAINYRIPMSEFEKMVEPRFRISRSYFIRSSTAWYGEDCKEDEAMFVDNTWGEIDMLIVPFTNENDSAIGYLTVENPENPDFSLGDIIESLENVSTLAVIAIRNARIFEELSSKNERLKVYADKLSSLNKMKSNFVTTISHEFRTPLTSIKAYCDTLIKNSDSVDRELLKEFLFVINEESGRLMSLVEDILDFSQIESGALKFERRPCNLNELLENAAVELAKNFKLKKITLHRRLPEDKVIIHAEGELLKQLIVNLLHNATKFSKSDGNVWLRLEEEVAAVRIVVEDDGMGIPEDKLEKVFEQFYQVDGSNTKEHGGSGLGLALCKGIVDWHDGKIWVQNMTGGGARFVVVIPKKQVVVKSHTLKVSNTVRRFEVERFLELLVENVAELMSVDKVSIMLIDREREELRIESAIGIQEEVVQHARVKLGEGISGKVAQDGVAMLVEDIESDKRVARSNNDPFYGSKSFLSVPIRLAGDVAGVVNVSSPIGRPVFTTHDRSLLETFVERLSVAVEELERFAESSLVFEKVRDTFKAILESKRFIESRDNDLISTIVTKATKKLGLDNEMISTLPYILSLYDLGLTKVGFHILKKPRDLSPKDREEIEKHTVLGSELLRVIEPSPRVRDVVLYHHENYDGSGYPGKLRGDAIPLEARIIRVADSLRALISERPYQRKYTFTEAKEVLSHRAGTFFDPKIVEAFVEVMDECAASMEERPNDVVTAANISQSGAPKPV